MSTEQVPERQSGSSFAEDAGTIDPRVLAAPRFAVIVNSLGGRYQGDILRGIRRAFHGKADLLVIVRPNLGPFAESRSLLLKSLPHPEVADGLILLSGTLGLEGADIRSIVAHYQRHRSDRFPIVSVGVLEDGVPAVVVDESLGLTASVRHLIDVHSRSRIAFLCGPDGNPEALRRFLAYKKAVGNLFNESYVVPNGDFTFRCGKARTEKLIAEWPDIDAIVAANDEMGRGALYAIQMSRPATSRAVIGFDDTEFAEALQPRLTTVRQPLEEQGLIAARFLLDLHSRRNSRRSQFALPTELRIRESCGCVPARRKTTLREVRSLVSQLFPGDHRLRGLIRRLIRIHQKTDWEGDLADLRTRGARLLENRLEDATESDIGVWHSALFALRNASLTSLSDQDPRSRTLDSFWVEQMDSVARKGAWLMVRHDDHRQLLVELEDSLRTCSDGPQKVAILARVLPQLSISKYSVAIDQQPANGSNAVKVIAQSPEKPEPHHPEAEWRSSEVSVKYFFAAEGLSGNLTFSLGAPGDWWLYAEVASIIAKAFGGVLLEGLVNRIPGGLSQLDLANQVSPRDLPGLKLAVLQELDRLQLVLQFDRASVQIVSEEARSLFVSRGFGDQPLEPGLLRPISIDSLIRQIVDSKDPYYLSDIRSEPNWKPSTGDLSRIQSWIGAPIFYSDALCGFLTVDFYNQIPDLARFAPQIKRFTTRVAPTIGHACPLLGEYETEEVIALVHQTIGIIGEKLDPKELFEAIVTQATQRLRCSHCTVFLPDRVDEQLLLKVERTSGPPSILERVFRASEGLAGYVYKTGQSVMLEDARKDPRFLPGHSPPNGPRSMLVVPIKVGDQTIGVISADQDMQSWFRARDRQLLEALGQQAGMAIQRSRSVDFMQDIAKTILSLDDARKILERVVEKAVDLVNGTAGIIFHLSDDKRTLRDSYNFPPNIEQPSPRLHKPDGLTRSIIDTRLPIPILDIRSDSRVNPDLRKRFCSMIGVPLTTDDSVVGVLFVNDADPHVFSDTEKSLLCTLGSQAAMALQKATLLAQRDDQMKRHQRLEAQLKRLHEVAVERDVLPLLDRVAAGLSFILGQDVWARVILHSEKDGTFREYPFCESSQPAGGARLPGAFFFRYVLNEGRAVYWPGGAISNLPQEIETLVEQTGVHSLAALPLELSGRASGILCLGSQAPVQFQPDIRRVLELFALHVGIAIRNARQYEEVQDQHKFFSLNAAERVGSHMKDFVGIEHALSEQAKGADRHDIEQLHLRIRAANSGLKRTLDAFHQFGERLVLCLDRGSLREIVGRSAERVRARFAEAQIAFDVNILPDGPISLQIDTSRMQDCVGRLLDNARVALQPAGAAALRLARKREVRLSTRWVRRWVVIRVEDSGPGFPEGMQVGKPFVGNNPEMAGVGLTIVNEVVRAHGGEMVCGRSEDLKGAKVELWLPAKE